MKQFFKMMFASAFGVLIAVGVLILCSVCFVVAVIASTEGGTAYVPEKNSVFKLSLKGSLSDQAVVNPLDEFMGEESTQVSLADVTKAIRRAKTNDNIKGIYLEAGDLSGGFASFEAVRRELTDFKESGKFIIAYGDFYTQGCYYLASVADSVYLNPIGSVALSGLSYHALFYSGLAEKLGVEPMLFKVGTYKSFAEPYVLKKFSDANREQIGSYMGSVWGNMSSAIAANRQMSVNELNQLVDEGIVMGGAEKILEKHLVDALNYRHEVEEIVKAKAGQVGDDKLKSATVDKIASIEQKEKEYGDKIALLYAEGDIVMEESSSPWDVDEKAITTKMVKQIQKLRKDNNVKAVVLRVNSPGGVAFVAEQIWKSLVELKAEKPLVVSMGDYAASGGYYIAAPANCIFAERTTLTGSIGVFGLFPNLTGTFEKIGVTSDVVSTNKYGDLGNISRPMREDEKMLIQGGVERTYDIFLRRCAEGRGMTKAQIDSIGQGRVWTGQQAVENGLVDQLGGLDEAISEAAKLAELTDYSITIADTPKDFMTRFLERKLEETKLSLVKNVMGEQFELFRQVHKAQTEQGIMARIPFERAGL